jgi:hypothetical protein
LKAQQGVPPDIVPDFVKMIGAGNAAAAGSELVALVLPAVRWRQQFLQDSSSKVHHNYDIH